jgi:hypothetical protein
MGEVNIRRALPLHVTWMLALAMVYITWVNHRAVPLGADSHAYWSAWSGEMYGQAPGTLNAYLYSPAFAQAVWPIVQLPWPAFGVVWALVTVGALVFLFLPLGWRWVAPLVLLCAPEIASGNVFWLLAVVAAFGLRHPSLWTVALLTKLTPGLGPLWFALRREWRNLAISLVITLGVVLVSFAVAPDLWTQWLVFLIDHASSSEVRVGSPAVPPLVIRLPLGLLLLVVMALTDRRWGLPLAMVLVTPVSGIAALTILAALPRLLLCDGASPDPDTGSPAEQRDEQARLHDASATPDGIGTETLITGHHH